MWTSAPQARGWSPLTKPTTCSPPPTSIQHHNVSICYLEALNAVVALKVWAPMFTGNLVHLFSDNTTAVAILQTGRGRDAFIQACTREICLTCATWDSTLSMGHVSSASLEGTADALSCWHLGQPYQARVDRLLATHTITCISVPGNFSICPKICKRFSPHPCLYFQWGLDDTVTSNNLFILSFQTTPSPSHNSSWPLTV